MPEISTAVIQAFCEPQGTDVFESKSNRSEVTFIIEGLLTHFFCYFDKPEKRNISWLLEYINEQEHFLMVQSPRLSIASHLSMGSRSSSYDSEEIHLPLLSSYSNTYFVPLTVLKYFLLRILGSCSEGKEGKKQWVPPFETEVNCNNFCLKGSLYFSYKPYGSRIAWIHSQLTTHGIHMLMYGFMH